MKIKCQINFYSNISGWHKNDVHLSLHRSDSNFARLCKIFSIMKSDLSCQNLILGCTTEELEEMEKNVGGFMTPNQVGTKKHL